MVPFAACAGPVSYMVQLLLARCGQTGFYVGMQERLSAAVTDFTAFFRSLSLSLTLFDRSPDRSDQVACIVFGSASLATPRKVLLVSSSLANAGARPFIPYAGIVWQIRDRAATHASWSVPLS